MRAIVAVLLATMAATARPACAQDAASLAIYRRLEKTYPVPDAARLAAALEPAVARYAATWKTCRPASLAVVKAWAASADQVVIGQVARMGAHNGWIVAAAPAGCADRTPIRFLAIEAADGHLEAAVAGFGDGLAWPSLARDTQRAAMIAAGVVLPRGGDCAQMPPRRAEEHVVSRDPDLAAPVYGVIFAGSWRELWTFESCGRRATVPVSFRADGDGGGYYQIANDDVRKLPAAGAPASSVPAPAYPRK